MKKTATKHPVRLIFDATDFFSRNIGFLGLIVIIILFAIYFVNQRVATLEQKFINMNLENTSVSTPESKMSNPETLKK